MALELRRAGAADLAAVGELTARVYRDEGYVLFPDGSTDEAYLAELADAARRDRDGEVVVAVEDGALLGSLTWCGDGSPMREVSTQPDQGEIRMLAVDPRVRGRGTARALVRWCLARAADDGLREIVLCSLEAMTAAHALYRSLGFRRDEALDWTPVPGIRLIGFRRDVDPGADRAEAAS